MWQTVDSSQHYIRVVRTRREWIQHDSAVYRAAVYMTQRSIRRHCGGRISNSTGGAAWTPVLLVRSRDQNDRCVAGYLPGGFLVLRDPSVSCVARPVSVLTGIAALPIVADLLVRDLFVMDLGTPMLCPMLVLTG